MGERGKHFDYNKSVIPQSALSIESRTVTLPPQNNQAFAQYQDFSTLAGNALALAYPKLINPVLLNGTGTSFSAIDPAGTDRGIYLPIPCCPVISMGVGFAFVFSVRWRGIDHVGRPVYFTEKKTHTAGGGAVFLQSICCFSYIDTCEIIEWGGLSTDSLAIGVQYNLIQGGAGNGKRIGIPWGFDAASDLIGAQLVETGGGTFSVGTLGSTMTMGALDLSLRPPSPDFQTGLINLGNSSVDPTSPFRVVVAQKYPERMIGSEPTRTVNIGG